MNKPSPPEIVEDSPIVVVDPIKKAAEVSARVTVQAQGYLDSVNAYVIDSPEMYEVAVAEMSTIRGVEKDLEDLRDANVRPLNTQVKQINALFKAPSELLAKAKSVIGPKMIAYEDGQRQRREAAEKLAADAARKAQQEADDALAAAAQALAENQPGAEAALVEAQIVSTIAAVAIANPVAIEDPLDRGGHAKRVTWTGVITDMPKFLHHVADALSRGEETFNTSAIEQAVAGQLNKFANATKGSVPIPGVSFSKQSTLIARAS